MVGVLMEVSGWKGLAAELNIEIGVQNDIEFKCRDDAKCYRRSLVRKYCDSTGLPVELVAENISRALEPDNKRQANMIRNMFPSGDKSTGKFPLAFFAEPQDVFLPQEMNNHIVKEHHPHHHTLGILKEDQDPAMASKHRTTMTFEQMFIHMHTKTFICSSF